jgi:hypothetical protein
VQEVVCENTLLPLPDAGANHNAIIPQVRNLVIIDILFYLLFFWRAFCHSFAYVAHFVFWAMFGFEPSRELLRSKQMCYQLSHPSPFLVDIRRHLDSHYRSINLIFGC